MSQLIVGATYNDDIAVLNGCLTFGYRKESGVLAQKQNRFMGVNSPDNQPALAVSSLIVTWPRLYTMMKNPIAKLALSLLFLTPVWAEKVTSEKLSPAQRIDYLVEKGLKEKGLKFNEPVSDSVFVRRIYLDIIGRIPTKTETETFLIAKRKNKRNALIDELLNSEGYVSHHYHYWADLLRARTAINANNLSSGTGRAYENWIKDALRENKPYDEMVYELLTATGHSWENGAVGYYIRDYGMPLDNTAMTAQVFLGTQIVCAQCHNHPFDKWTQMDYYHMAAFTYGMMTTNRLPGGEGKISAFLKNSNRKKMNPEQQKDLRRAFSEILKPVRFNNVVSTERKPRLPHDYQYDDAKPKSVIQPASIMGPKAILSPGEIPAESFAKWMTSPDNPRFTLVMANRLWKKAFGIGLIEPADNLKDHTMASNPELMKFLERHLKKKDYDMKAFLATIYKSQTYQRVASVEEVPLGTPYYFPGPILRRMSAEQVWDSIVAMIKEDPDTPDANWDLLGKETILRRQLIGEAVYNQKPGQFVRNGMEILRVQKTLSTKIENAVTKLNQAREADDLALIEEASKDVKEARKELVTEIEQRVYLESLKENVELVSNQQSIGNDNTKTLFTNLAETIEASDPQGLSMGMDSMASGRGTMISKLARAMLAEEKNELEQQALERSRREMEEWGVKKRGKKLYSNFNKIRNTVKRASDMPSPAPAGHFLREFGQSDRELIENASDQASVTQALTMLNGNFSLAIANPYSVFSREMREGSNFQERINNVYMVMFSRPATNEEIAIFQEAFKEDPDAASFSNIAWTLLNTRQFLFIQ